MPDLKNLAIPTKSKSPTNLKCYASQHLRPQEYGVWEVCMRLTSGGENKLYFDGRAMAARFAGISKSSMYRIVKALDVAGWLVPLNGMGKKVSDTTKRYKATEYQVLTHEQWIAVHGCSGCASGDVIPVPSTGMEPVPSTGTSSPTGGNVQSQNSAIPVPPAGHSLVFSSVKESSVKESSIKAPVFDVPSWIPSDAWLGFKEVRKRKKAPDTDRALKLIIGKLDKFRAEGQDVAAILDQSVERGWTGVFPLKQATAAKPSRPSLQDTDYCKGLVGFVV